MKSQTSNQSSVDAYVTNLPIEKRKKMEEFRQLMKKIAPNAVEKMSYGMPGWEENGMLVWFAAWKLHYGLYPHGDPLAAFENKLIGYKTSKGCIQIPAKDPLPIKLITEIVKYRQKQLKSKQLIVPLSKNKSQKNNI